MTSDTQGFKHRRKQMISPLPTTLNYAAQIKYLWGNPEWGFDAVFFGQEDTLHSLPLQSSC